MIHRGLRERYVGVTAGVLMLLVIGALPLAAQGVREQFFRGGYSFTCDRLDIFHGQRRAELTGSVEVWNDTSEILADRLVVHYTGNGDTVEVVEAFGEVEITNDSQGLLARGDYARYEAGSDTMFLRGNAYIQQGPNEFESNRMWFDFTRQVVRMRDSVSGNVRRENRR